jgi:hypothetical protein
MILKMKTNLDDLTYGYICIGSQSIFNDPSIARTSSERSPDDRTFTWYEKEFDFESQFPFSKIEIFGFEGYRRQTTL